MAITLEELKQQREQLQKHLDWLNAKIAELSPTTEGEPSPEPSKKQSPPPASSPPPATTSTQSEPTTEPTTEPRQPNDAELAPPALDIESSYKPKTQSEIQRAKIGCLLIFAFATALFLFLLFGLPYLL
ncbi:hypothetical protein SH580_15485 [Coraliomargarita algicola]|uniref:Uncharacterized protein n=1 Tax=Coraliomargarita algicola TaxID=3092156 RepID=A0ABZ0RPG3_9BACT|nr:hypothetical protein [Coraliomargarita sp. J2-16]WPJ94834.1 hypothetical protein SH580_15485 [Coraliomargarita sp. J2-16]